MTGATRASTLDDYQQRITRVVRHIEDNLDASLSVDELAGIAAFSPYHFHRVFRGMVGETVKSYVKRVRLERAAFSLNYTGHPVTRVAFEAGYESHEAFTRAFRARFGCAPRDFAGSPAAAQSRSFAPSPPEASVEVRHREPTRIAFVRSVGPVAAIEAAFGELFAFAETRDLPMGGGTLGISYDDPVVTDPTRMRFDAALPVADDIEGEGNVHVRTVPGGSHAVTRYRGPYTEMHTAYVELVGQWFPRSGKEPANAGCLEFYLNDPRQTAPQDLLTDIWVPIAP